MTDWQRQTDRLREYPPATDVTFFVWRERAGWRPPKYRRQHFRRLLMGVTLCSLVLRLLQSCRVSPAFALNVPLSTTMSKPEIQTERLNSSAWKAGAWKAWTVLNPCFCTGHCTSSSSRNQWNIAIHCCYGKCFQSAVFSQGVSFISVCELFFSCSLFQQLPTLLMHGFVVA